MTARLSVPRLVAGLAILIAAFAGNAYGQEAPLQPETQAADPAKFPTMFDAYAKAYGSEKIYIHTDKDSYLAGETIWMRAYRTDAATLSPYSYSGLMYIEVRDPENKMMHRMQIMRTDSVFQATYKIPSGWPSGNYELVAYTNWMQNFSDDFFFKKKVYIFNASDNNVISNVSYFPNTDNNTVDVRMKISTPGGIPYRGTVDVTPYANGGKQDILTQMINKDGETSFSYKTMLNVTGFNVQFHGGKDLAKFERLYRTPVFSDSIDVQFMPEGGHLLAGVAQQVGFKAIGLDGKSVAVKGQVRDSLGNMVGFFESQHLGMGRFAIQAQAGTSYFADVTTEDGKAFSFRLPTVAESGVAVSTSIRNGTLTCMVQGTPNFDYTGLALVVHSRGRVVRWGNIQSAAALQLPIASLPEGILHCFVVDQAGTALSERMVLINKDMSPEVQVDGLRPSYARRQKVELDLNVLYGGTQPLPADLSVSVVDTKSAVADKSENIVSYLTMSSDIKGKVENAAYYFDKSVPLREREAKADLLMMTQAWTRFDVDSIFRGKPANMPFTIEQGQYLAGKIKPLWGKKTITTGRMLLVGINQDPDTKTALFQEVEADSTGFFEATNLTFPKNTTFILQGQQNGNKTNVEVVMEEQMFARIKPDLLTGRFVYKPETAPPPVSEAADLYQSRGIQYFYDQNGERVYALETVTVTARADGGDPKKRLYDDYADNHIVAAQLEEQAYSTIRDYLESVGVEIRIDETDMTERLYLRNKPARIFVDEMGYSDRELFSLPISEVEEIWVVRDPVTLSMLTMDALGDPVQGGVIIHTKGGMGISDRVRQTPSFFQFRPLGYSVPAKFYSPKYDGTNKSTDPDERVTVYWNPKVKTDMNGKAKVEFYTTDAFTEYRMVIQGMAGSQTMGLPIYKEITIKSGM